MPLVCPPAWPNSIASSAAGSSRIGALLGGDPGIGKSTLLIQATADGARGRTRGLHVRRGGGRADAAARRASARPTRRCSLPRRPGRGDHRHAHDAVPAILAVDSIQTV